MSRPTQQPRQDQSETTAAASSLAAAAAVYASLEASDMASLAAMQATLYRQMPEFEQLLEKEALLESRVVDEKQRFSPPDPGQRKTAMSPQIALCGGGASFCAARYSW